MKSDWKHNAIQFILTDNEAIFPEEWIIRKMGCWIIGHHHSLPIGDIYDNNNNHIGWMVGFAVSPRGEYNPKKIVFAHESLPTGNIIEKDIYSYGGRFICIIITENIKRIYLDPSGSLPAVYSENNRAVASTSGILSNDLDHDLISALDMPRSGLYFPFSFTAHKFIKRLLPNHYLDLNNFKVSRHWPRPDDLYQAEVVATAITTKELIKHNIDTIARNYKICIPLTGGKDSRMLLACSQSVLSKINFVTIRSKGENADTHIVDILVRKFGLNHRYLYRKEANKAQLDMWLDIVGHAVSGFAWRDHPTYSAFEYDSILMPGICGEVARGFFYKKTDNEDDLLFPTKLLKRMKIPAYRVFLPRVAEYLDELKQLGLNYFQMLDMTYNEQRLGSWAGPSETGGDMFSIGKLWPMCHRNIIASYINLPTFIKMQGSLPEMVIERAWPELLNVPFNSYTGPLGHILNTGMLIKRCPSWVIEKFRARKF